MLKIVPPPQSYSCPHPWNLYVLPYMETESWYVWFSSGSEFSWTMQSRGPCEMIAEGDSTHRRRGGDGSRCRHPMDAAPSQGILLLEAGSCKGWILPSSVWRKHDLPMFLLQPKILTSEFSGPSTVRE